MITRTYSIDKSNEGKRVDQFLTEQTGFTRSEVQKWIKTGNAYRQGEKKLKSNYRLEAGDIITFSWEVKEEQTVQAENIPLDILYEDEDMIVINKRRGMVCHPAPGNEHGTLASALLFHCGESIRQAGDSERPGIVHRLDKDTSGVMVAAKSARAYENLRKQIGEHTAVRRYVTLVHGQMEGDHGEIRFPLGRSTKDRMKWDVQPETGKPAVTHFRVIEYMKHFSYLECPFFELFCGSSFCPVFSLRFGRSVHHSSNSLSRITFNILRSRREICTCVVWSSFAVSLWVLPP